ncbi:MAG TPA: FHA domain-containing protein [Anaerolineales bacterium]|nr:FHA domain-containing protein [Anaerolineales bacterium]
MERSSEDIPVIVGQTGPLNGQRWMLRNRLIVGRDSICDIIIPSRQVSRQHAQFTISPRGVILEDMQSKNGTHLNGKMIEDQTLLQDGDVVQIALAQQFIFLSSDATLPLELFDTFEVQPAVPGRLRFEKRARQVWIGDEEVSPPLSVSQYRLLEILYEHEGRVVPRKEVIARIWGVDNAVEVSEQAFDALVRRLRDRLAALDPHHAYIVTVRGHGIRLENPPK